MHLRLVVQLLTLLALANVTPVIVNKVLGTRRSYPLDCGLKVVDGRPLFGSSKNHTGNPISDASDAVGAPLV